MGSVLRYLVFVLLLQSLSALAQTDSLFIEIPGCTITDSKRVQFAPAQSHQEFTTAEIDQNKGQNLSEILNSNTLLFIRSYGKPGVSSISARGTSASESNVIWNGFSLQDPLNGGVNPNLIPLFFLDRVEIIAGGISALYGSGSIGGIINLSSTASYTEPLSVQLLSSAASFGNYRNGIGISGSKNRIASKLKVFNGCGKNDFQFKNTTAFGSPIETQQHAQMREIAVQQENNFRISSIQNISNFAFFQKSEHQIPPMMFQNKSEKMQTDENLRLGFEYTNTHPKSLFVARTAFIAGTMTYTDQEINLYSKHSYFTNQSEAELKIALPKKQLLNLGVFNSNETSYSKDLGGENKRNRLAALVSYRKEFHSKIEMGGNIRQEFISHRLTQPTYSLFFIAPIIKQINASLSSSRNYRVPTFNELYWKDAAAIGNPKLKNESGYSNELALFGDISKLNYRINFFHSSIRNKIYWLPVNNVWTSENQQKVLSRGLEVRLNYQIEFGGFKVKIGGMYSFSKSTIEEINSTEDIQILHKQLVFTPEHIANATINIEWKIIKLTTNQTFTGKRFTSSDNLLYQPFYSITDFHLHFKLKGQKNTFMLGLSANNVFNIQYQVMPNYASMGRNFECSLQYQFNK